MRVEALETVRHAAHPNLLHVIVHAEDGTSGLGETFFDAAAVEEILHELLGPALLGEPVDADPAVPAPSGGFRSPEWSARSALDLALHDLRARLRKVRLAELLGGAVRESVPAYVTCIDPHHEDGDWGLGVPGGSRHHDWTASFERPAELTGDLAAEGFGGAKLFPFARVEAETGGTWISPELLAEQARPFAEMRAAAPDGFALFCDLAGGWSLEPALAIARSLEPYELAWLEDPLPADALDDLRRLADSTTIPIAGHETRAGLRSFRELLRCGAVSVVHVDLQWCGGLSEGARVAALAGAQSLPLAFHDCAGPVAWAASLHAALAWRPATWLECARPYAIDAYPAMVDGAPRLEGGRAVPGSGPGHGVTLKDHYLAAARVRSTCR